MSNNKRYGEETEMVCFRVPKSKKNEIKQLVKLKLNEYEKSVLTSTLGDVLEEKLKWNQESEKKSNSSDDDKSTSSGMNNFERAIDSVSEKKKVDMDALRKIASGEGLKGEFELTKKKVDIGDKYDFMYVKSLPDVDDQVFIEKKNLALIDKYNPGIFYVKWEDKYLMFEDKAEFDRFAKEYLTLI